MLTFRVQLPAAGYPELRETHPIFRARHRTDRAGARRAVGERRELPAFQRAWWPAPMYRSPDGLLRDRAKSWWPISHRDAGLLPDAGHSAHERARFQPGRQRPGHPLSLHRQRGFRAALHARRAAARPVDQRHHGHQEPVWRNHRSGGRRQRRRIRQAGAAHRLLHPYPPGLHRDGVRGAHGRNPMAPGRPHAPDHPRTGFGAAGRRYPADGSDRWPRLSRASVSARCCSPDSR